MSLSASLVVSEKSVPLAFFLLQLQNLMNHAAIFVSAHVSFLLFSALPFDLILSLKISSWDFLANCPLLILYLKISSFLLVTLSLNCLISSLVFLLPP